MNKRSTEKARAVQGRILEGLIGAFNPTPKQWAERIVNLFTAPELAAHKGAMFGQKATPILPLPEFKGAATVAKWVAGLEALAERALAA